MTPVTIILTVIILLLVYVLYAYMTGTVTNLAKSTSLSVVNPPITDIAGSRNTRYGYTIWVYVNTWDNNSKKTIFSRNNNIRVYLDDNSPTLKVQLTMNNWNAVDNAYVTDEMIVTKNFPLQKWVCISVSVDNQFVDAYLDGKLVKSHRFYNKDSGAMPIVPPDASSAPINLGNSNGSVFDAYVSEFKRSTVPIDPETAWNNYLEGNGTNAVSRAFSSYGIDVAILKNNVKQTSISF